MEAFDGGEAEQAARILLSLRKRRLQRWPEWAPVEAGEASAAVAVEVAFQTAVWPKGPRSARLRLPGDWKASLAVLKDEVAGATRSGGEERERSRERHRARPGATDAPAAPARIPTTPAYYVVHAGSGPSTSADSSARPHTRPRAGDKVAAQAQAVKAAVAAPPKEPMSASSPETPLDFGAAAAGSGASSSWDDAARVPPKRRTPGARGSGGASSGDEGCSSPAKRKRVFDAGGEAAVEEKEISEPKMPSEPSTNSGDKEVKFMFDLNIPWTDDCSDVC